MIDDQPCPDHLVCESCSTAVPFADWEPDVYDLPRGPLGRTYQVDEVRLAYRLHEAERTVPLPVPERLHYTWEVLDT
ncbi:hypothetical protein [Nocardia abscessus]|uniref:hypothetical protein n=1 Tax=Nocardia abscessus TaxID=120957 RepID=UPI002457D0E5|nr:hypothetical protein [Nocardia abscessus]